MRKKILIVFGTRPEAIKMAPLVKAFDEVRDIFDVRVCVTAQHREMLDQVLEIFEIKPDFDLDIMKQQQDLFDITSNILLNFRNVLDEVCPDLVMVHGDTTTTFSVALSCYYKKISVAHVEAGLRTGNIYAPWPEEINRKLTGSLTRFHFAPTEQSKRNLLNEDVDEHSILITGNTVVDALFWVLDRIEHESALKIRLEGELRSLLNGVALDTSRLILITGHRRENFGEGIINICKAIKTLAEKYSDAHFIYPVHLNPNVVVPVNKLLGDIKNVHLIDPLSYLPFVYLMNRSYLILTDSGGIQEEAPGLGKPVLVMREATERPEAVEAGTVKLVGTDYSLIIEQVSRLMDDKGYYQEMSKAENPYGDGKACGRIVDFLKVNL